jgi:SAM-dependent methyltransferase
MAKRTRSPELQIFVDVAESNGFSSLGYSTNQTYHDDPRRLAFVFARYKFVAKMLSGAAHALEVGCGDAFASRLVRQEVGALTVVDYDQLFIDDVGKRANAKWPLTAFVHDILADGPVPGSFDAVYSLDLLEHLDPDADDAFVRNCVSGLDDHGTFLVGSPSKSSLAHASEQSRQGHINCKDGDELKALMRRHFHNVFLFSMNDEVVHTGFYPLAHYYLALCCGQRSTPRAHRD